jgi:hypothetical protein
LWRRLTFANIRSCPRTRTSSRSFDAALACRPAALRVEAEDGDAVEWLARAGLLINAGDGTVTPTRAAVHYDELVRR